MTINRRGYFFIIDALIGSTIIVLALMVILTSGARSPNISYDYAIAEDISSFLLNTRLQDLSNDYVINLTAENIITNSRHTLMEQIDEFYFYRNSGSNLSIANRTIANITSSILSNKYGFSFTMQDVSGRRLIYNKDFPPLAGARVVIVSRKITFLQINESTLYGPALAEVKVWI